MFYNLCIIINELINMHIINEFGIANSYWNRPKVYIYIENLFVKSSFIKMYNCIKQFNESYYEAFVKSYARKFVIYKDVSII